jgi:hypothetical protein
MTFMRSPLTMATVGLISLGALLVTTLNYQPAMADSASDISTITLTPVTQRIEASTSQTKTGSLTVINNGKTDYDFIVYSRPYSVSDIQYKPDFTTLSSRADAYSWVQFNKTSYHLTVGQRVDIAYTLHVPSNATPGGHYGVIFAEMQPKAQDNAQSILRKKRVGTILFVNVKGATIEKGSFVRDNVPFWQTQPPLTSSLQLRNDGNTDFAATTSLVVKDLFGHTKYGISQQASVFPSTTREISMQWSESPWFGLYKVELHASYLKEVHDSSHYVLLMPRWLPVIFIVTLLIGAAYAAIRRRR